jgi:methionyl-tRNA formyltransferase
MQMDVGLDTGDIISSVSFPIGPRDNFGDIHDRSCEVGGELLIGTLRQIESGEAVRTPQNDAGASYAAKIEKAECKLDFTKSAKTLDCLIRGVTPIPGAFAYLNGKMLKIYDAIPFEGSFGAAGTVVEVSSSGDGYFTVACGEGALKVLGVIPEGKGKMTSGDLIRGRKINKGDVLQ